MQSLHPPFWVRERRSYPDAKALLLATNRNIWPQSVVVKDRFWKVTLQIAWRHNHFEHSSDSFRVKMFLRSIRPLSWFTKKVRYFHQPYVDQEDEDRTGRAVIVGTTTRKVVPEWLFVHWVGVLDTVKFWYFKEDQKDWNSKWPKFISSNRRYNDMDFLISWWSIETHTSVAAWGEFGTTSKDVVVLTCLYVLKEVKLSSFLETLNKLLPKDR